MALLTRDVAIALGDAQVRRQVYDALHDSPYSEHKLHFRTFLRSAGKSLVTGMARARGVSDATCLAMVDSVLDMEFYMPSKEHWKAWDGGADLIVASELEERGPMPVGFDLAGRPVPFLSHREGPLTPTLALVPVETDFSSPPTSPVHPSRATLDAGPGVYMVSADIPDRGESWLRGSPELEVHAFVRNAYGDFVDVQCAGEGRAYPFGYNQDDQTWSGEVMIVPESGIGTNPVEFSVWEDDDIACGEDGGRPPRVNDDVIGAFNSWGARPVASVTLVDQQKISSPATVGVPMVLTWDSANGQSDDEVGEATMPSCWARIGSTRFDLRYSSAGHGSNGKVRLEFRFGQTDPLCPPPAFSLAMSGPTSGAAYEWVTVTAIPLDYVAPVTYSWRVNDSAACGTSDSCSVYLGAGGTYTRFDVTATDDEPATADGYQIVFACYGTPPCAWESPQPVAGQQPRPNGPGNVRAATAFSLYPPKMTRTRE